MAKTCRKLSFLFFLFGSLFFLSAAAGATELEPGLQEYEGEKVYVEPTGEIIGAAFETDENGNLVEIPLEEYAKESEVSNLLNGGMGSPIARDLPIVTPVQNGDSVVVPNAYNYFYYTFTRKSSTTVLKPTIKVSADLNCVGSATPCPITKATATTVTELFSITVNAEAKEVIKGAVGYSKSTAKSSTTTYGVSVPVGKTGYLGFKPRMVRVYGDLKYWNHLGSQHILKSTNSMYVDYPKLLTDGKTADGQFVIVIR